jgi:hypothetical protein
MIGKSRHAIFFFVVILLIAIPSAQATFFGEVKTGLQNVASDQYGYTLYVPTEYSPERSWPLVVLLKEEGDLAEEFIQDWVGLAQSRGFLVYCPNYPKLLQGSPREIDKWLLRHKSDIEKQFEVDPNRTWVAGSGFGGHYGLYLGLRYPKEFAAIASLGDALQGRLTKLFIFSYRQVTRLPVLVMKQKGVSEDAELSQAELENMRSRGYSVEIVEKTSKSELATSTAGPQLFNWLEQTSLKKQRALEEPKPSRRERLMRWFEKVLQNE